MSWRATTAVKMESRTEGGALLFALMLADYADDYGICWPAVTTLAEDCRVNERTVRRQIEHAESLGELIVYRRRRATSVYILNLPSLKPWDGEARRKIIEALTDYPDDLDRTICPRTEGAEELSKNLSKTSGYIDTPPLVDIDTSSSARDVHVEREALKAVPYFEGTQERVPPGVEVVGQDGTNKSMAWDGKEWRYVEWAS